MSFTAVKYIYTHTFNAPLSGTTHVSRYHKGKTNLDPTGARDSERQRHQLGHTLETDNHARGIASTHHSASTGRTPLLPPNQQRQSSAEKQNTAVKYIKTNIQTRKDIRNNDISNFMVSQGGITTSVVFKTL